LQEVACFSKLINNINSHLSRCSNFHKKKMLHASPSCFVFW
jgi:hypothetical protein